MTLRRHALRDLALMVGEKQVKATAMDVESLPKILFSHRGAFKMPSRETLAPGRGPVHYMLRRSLLPKGKVERIAFLLLSVEFTGRRKQILDISSGKLAVVMVAVVFLHIEIDRSVAFIGISGVEYLLDILYLLDNMA